MSADQDHDVDPAGEGLTASRNGARRDFAVCERCRKEGERPNDLITAPGWFVMFATFDPADDKSEDDRLIIHACSLKCREALWTSKPRTFAKTTFDLKEQPAIYPCGCSKHKINLGLCDGYEPHELP